jgi:hypothetical protein
MALPFGCGSPLTSCQFTKFTTSQQSSLQAVTATLFYEKLHIEHFLSRRHSLLMNVAPHKKHGAAPAKTEATDKASIFEE